MIMKLDIAKTDPDMISLDLIGDDERGYDFLDDAQLVKLKQIKSDNGVLSVYLDTQSSKDKQKTVLTRFKNGIKQIREAQQDSWDHDEELRFEAVVKHISAWIENEMGEPSGKGIALFASPQRVLPKKIKKLKVDYDLFEVFHLPDTPEDVVAWEKTVVLTPLLVSKDEHPETGVILFDRKEARFFLYTMGEAAEYNINLKNPDPVAATKAHTWHGYGTHNHEQWQEEHYKRYLRQAAIAISKVAKIAGWKWITLLSPDEQEAKHMLDFFSKDMRSKIIGTDSLSMKSTINDVRDTVAPIVDSAEKSEELQTLNDWVNELKTPDGLAVSGVADTVLAAQEYRVRTLLFPADFIQKGWECQSCGGLFADLQAEPIDECPYCGSGDLLDKVDILGDVAVQILQTDGEVEVIRDAENRKILDDNGMVGGLLRY